MRASGNAMAAAAGRVRKGNLFVRVRQPAGVVGPTSILVWNMGQYRALGNCVQACIELKIQELVIRPQKSPF
jgi:hypothetical protein